MTYSDKIFSVDEKTSFLGRLTSDLQSTRFMCIKFLSMSIANNMLDIKHLAEDDPIFFEDLCMTLKNMTQNTHELSLIQNEAEIVLNHLKPFLREPAQNVCNIIVEEGNTGDETEVKNVCAACNAFCDEDWLYCPRCGARL